MLFMAHNRVSVWVHVHEVCARKSTCMSNCVCVCVCSRVCVGVLACLLVLHSHLVSGQSSEPLEGTWPAACSPGSASPCQPPHLAWPAHGEQIAECSQKQPYTAAWNNPVILDIFAVCCIVLWTPQRFTCKMWMWYFEGTTLEMTLVKQNVVKYYSPDSSLRAFGNHPALIIC